MKTVLKFGPAGLSGLLVVLTPLLMALSEPLDSQAAIIFPPGWSNAEVLRAAARADVNLVRFGSLDNIGIIEISDDQSVRRIRAAGGWLALPPGVLGGCLLSDSAARLSPLAAPTADGVTR